MKRLRRVSEAEVIAEFLKNEFYRQEFSHDREQFERMVLEADLSNERENAIRRALLFRRRGHMWRELPRDTQWWQVQIEEPDLQLIRVFPRADWRKVARGDFQLKNIVETIREGRFNPNVRQFVTVIQSLSYRLRLEYDNSSVLLIGIDERQPMTILEGNHRLTAALLASPAILQNRFRVLAGFSPHMRDSCWYETSLANLWRYGMNRLRNLHDREADLSRVLPQFDPVLPAATNESSVAHKAATEQK